MLNPSLIEEMEKSCLKKGDNILVIDSPVSPYKKRVAAIYFSSNGIYFPDTVECFHETIVQKNVFEWYKTRYLFADKHIFLRDLKKAWYIGGVNQYINSIEKLLSYLRKECGNRSIVTIGSSAGGYAALLFGVLLKAEMILAFAGQFSLKYELDHETNKLLYSHFF